MSTPLDIFLKELRSNSIFNTQESKKFPDGGPIYNPESKTWTSPDGYDITNHQIKSPEGLRTFLDSGAIEINDGTGYMQYEYAPNAHRPYIGGKPNQARQKYFEIDTELADSVKSKALKYGISPNTLASRIAKEGPIDEAINHYNYQNGKIYRVPMEGLMWGLDDVGTLISNGDINPETSDYVDTDVEFENEKNRTTYSVFSNNFLDGVELTAATLKYFKDKLRKRYPGISDALLEQYSNAAFNLGFDGATKLIDKGQIRNAYKPFINIKKDGGPIQQTKFRKWEELPIADRSKYMQVAVKNGYRDIRSIREAYNRFQDNGSTL